MLSRFYHEEFEKPRYVFFLNDNELNNPELTILDLLGYQETLDVRECLGYDFRLLVDQLGVLSSFDQLDEDRGLRGVYSNLHEFISINPEAFSKIFFTIYGLSQVKMGEIELWDEIDEDILLASWSERLSMREEDTLRYKLKQLTNKE